MDRSKWKPAPPLIPIPPARESNPVDPLASDTRPFFSELYKKHRFKAEDLAQLATTHISVVLAMLRARPVYRLQAEKVLQALSVLVNTGYNLTNVCVPLIKESNEGGSDARGW